MNKNNGFLVLDVFLLCEYFSHVIHGCKNWMYP